MSMGELTRKDNSLCFRRDGKNVYIPVENTKEIFCFNEVSINTKLLDFLSQNNIIIHFYNYYGGYSGTYYPKDHYLSGKLLVKQVLKYENDRMSVARAIVKGIGLNIYEVLYHYYKHGKKEVKETTDWIKSDFIRLVEQSQDVKELMAYEGEAWMRFYADFKYFLPEDFVMNKRVKRPPDNPINALVSFGNTLLYTKTISAIYQTHLDQRISFLHEPSVGRFSLSLDMSEVFKPVIVFRTIFDLVNNHRIQVEKHFEKNVNYCILNEEGRKIFVKAFEERMESVFEHSRLKRKVTYRTALKLDCYKLIKNILEDKDFVPTYTFALFYEDWDLDKVNVYYSFLFYDVGEKRVQKVFKVCKKYLTHYQKSVFRGDMTPSKFISIRSELNKVIDKDEDFVCIIKLMNDNVFGEEVLGNAGKETGEELMI